MFSRHKHENLRLAAKLAQDMGVMRTEGNFP